MANRDQGRERDRQRQMRERGRNDDPGRVYNREPKSSYDWEWDRSFNRKDEQSRGSYYRENFGSGYRQEHAVDRDFDRGGDDHHRGRNRAPDLEPYREDFDPGDSFDWEKVEERQIREHHFDRPYRREVFEQNCHRQKYSQVNTRQNQRQNQARGRWEQPETRGPYTGVGPIQYHRSDERIGEDICERLTRHGQIDARNIEIEVKYGEVKLSGRVNRRLEKFIAEDVAETVTGVKDIHNQIRVEEQRREQRTGGKIQPGMEVVTQDGERLGIIQEIREQDFRVSTGLGPDEYIPYSAIISSAEQVKLNLPSDIFVNQDWRRQR